MTKTTQKISNKFYIKLITFFTLISPLYLYADQVHFTILHLNDVYEISPIENGEKGGLARIKTLQTNLKKKNPNTITTFGGDLFSPSALGTAKVDGIALSGKQMVSAMNSLLDIATFGNHEFDIKEKEFYDRLKESKFKWISGNVFDKDSVRLPNVEEFEIIEIPYNKSNHIKIAFLGTTIPSNPVNYIRYTSPIESIQKTARILKPKVDLIIAITHLSIREDQELMESTPEIDLILGGHEHDNFQLWRGKQNRPILKADANGKTVYVVNYKYDTDSKKSVIQPKLVEINSSIKEDLKLKKIVEKWEKKAFQAFKDSGFEAGNIVTHTEIPLDGMEKSIRSKSTDLTDIICQSMTSHFPEAELSIFNGGAIRIDDVVSPGPIREYDILRILPFGGKIYLIEISGELLIKLLESGKSNSGNGGYLHYYPVKWDNESKIFLLNSKPIQKDSSYKIVSTEFLLSGKETNLSYFHKENSEIKILKEGNDLRVTLIHFLRNILNKNEHKK
jgi:5'-nucleotidase / UDP-sugar diphosphatase